MIPDAPRSTSARFQGQVAIIVGCAHGIGKAIASRLATESARIVLADIDCGAMENLAAGMRGAGADVHAVSCDATRTDQVTNMVGQALGWYNRIDILMYIAGIAPTVPFLELDETTWDNTMSTNLRGAFLVSRAVAPHMVQQKRGKLVFMASTNSWDGEPHLAHYNASKAGLYLLAKTLARELGPHGITANAVGPGFIRTRLTEPVLQDAQFTSKYDPAKGLIPIGRLGTPEDVAGPALFLASSDADYVNGVLLFVDGGQLA